jgi:hypothetical protein
MCVGGKCPLPLTDFWVPASHSRSAIVDWIPNTKVRYKRKLAREKRHGNDSIVDNGLLQSGVSRPVEWLHVFLVLLHAFAGVATKNTLLLHRLTPVQTLIDCKADYNRLLPQRSPISSLLSEETPLFEKLLWDSDHVETFSKYNSAAHYRILTTSTSQIVAAGKGGCASPLPYRVLL